MMNRGKCVLIGAGGFGREVVCWARDAADRAQFPELIGYTNDDVESLADYAYGLTYLGNIRDYVPDPDTLLILAIGDPGARRSVASELLKRGGRFATLIHPSAVVAGSSTVGAGSIICPHALVSADASIGEFVIINANSTVGHDVSLGSYCTLSAHVDITGAVSVGEEAFFGSGVRVAPQLRIGNAAKIGIGAVIMRSVPDGATMYAAPARQF